MPQLLLRERDGGFGPEERKVAACGEAAAGRFGQGLRAPSGSGSPALGALDVGTPRRLFAASSTRFSIARSSGLALSIRPSREPMDEHFFRWGGARASRTAQRRSTDQSEGSLQLCFLPRKESACARRGAVSGCATRGSGLRVLARLRAPQPLRGRLAGYSLLKQAPLPSGRFGEHNPSSGRSA